MLDQPSNKCLSKDKIINKTSSICVDLNAHLTNHSIMAAHSHPGKIEVLTPSLLAVWSVPSGSAA